MNCFKRRSLYLAVALGLAIFALAAQAVTGVRVIDGDTLSASTSIVTNFPTSTSVRLIGVNAPETATAKCPAEKAAGEAAKAYVKDRVAKAATISMTVIKWDKYGGRVDGYVLLDGKDLAQDLLAGGYAVAYSGGARVNVWCKK